MPKNKNLVDFKAQDGAKGLRRVTVHLTESQIEAVEALEGDRAVHLRAAVDLYLTNCGNTAKIEKYSCKKNVD